MEKNKSAAIETLKRMSRIRAELLNEYPFFGRLLLHLIPAVTDCGTACTDMTHLAFDPSFAAALSDGEMKFVMLHEVMHCVLKHCVRGKTLDPLLYNIACDIVVNSLILESMGVNSFIIGDEEPMHVAPDGQEGRLFTAEEVYDMLFSKAQKQQNPSARNGNDHSSGNGSGGNGNIPKKTGSGYPGKVDNHEIWTNIFEKNAEALSDKWEARIRSTSRTCGDGSGIPLGIKRYIVETEHMSRTNWRQVLAEFIKHNRSDFTFMKRDTRYTGDIIMPSFVENMYGDSVNNLWFCIDVSGSISDETLAAVYSEIMAACSQIDELSGQIAFFDTVLSDFTPFENEDDVANIEPVGGGGTSFSCVFDRLAECKNDELPVGIVILTDGYAAFPEENAAMSIPVLWVIVDSDVEPDWGTAVYVKQ